MKRITAMISVVYEDDLDKPTIKALRDGIDDALTREVGHGMLTAGAPEQLVDDYDIVVEEVR